MKAGIFCYNIGSFALPVDVRCNSRTRGADKEMFFMGKSSQNTPEKEQGQAQGLKIDKKTVISITALLFAIMIFAGILTQVIPRGVYQTDSEGMVIDGTYTRFEGDEGKMPWWKIIAAPVTAKITTTTTTK